MKFWKLNSHSHPIISHTKHPSQQLPAHTSRIFNTNKSCVQLPVITQIEIFFIKIFCQLFSSHLRQRFALNSEPQSQLYSKPPFAVQGRKINKFIFIVQWKYYYIITILREKARNKPTRLDIINRQSIKCLYMKFNFCYNILKYFEFDT